MEMQPDLIETKRLRLVGVEMYINLEEYFVPKIKAMRGEIAARLDEIQNRKNENIYVGFWHWPFTPEEHYSLHRIYFCGVEVHDFKNVPYGMTCKNLPESKFALFAERNGEEGTVTQGKNGAYQSWLPQSNYKVNYSIPGDFEVYYFDEKMENHEVWIPVVEK